MFPFLEAALSLSPDGVLLGPLLAALGKLSLLGRLRYWLHLFQAPTYRTGFITSKSRSRGSLLDPDVSLANNLLRNSYNLLSI